MSNRKNESNKRNAQQSTGPHDTSVTRFNATKHGLLSVKVTAADQELYELLLEQFRLELQSETAIEEVMLQRLALYAVRMHRAATLSEEFLDRQLTPHIENIGASTATSKALTYLATGEAPKGKLSDLRSAVEGIVTALGPLLAEAGNPGQHNDSVRAALDRFSAAVEMLPRGGDSSADALGTIQTIEATYQRYEFSLERGFFRVLDQFERIKRLRRGENVPAPLSVNVSVHGNGEPL